MANTTSQTTAPTCYFLDKLSAEMRNNIYELAFTATYVPADTTGEEVSLLDSKPPHAKALLQTCRQIHKEAKAMYKAKYQGYWSETRFTVSYASYGASVDWANLIKIQLRGIDARDVQHIVHLTCAHRSDCDCSLHLNDDSDGRPFQMEDRIGAWKLSTEPPEYFLFHGNPEGVHGICDGSEIVEMQGLAAAIKEMEAFGKPMGTTLKDQIVYFITMGIGAEVKRRHVDRMRAKKE